MAARHAARKPIRRRALIALAATAGLVASGAQTALASTVTSAALSGGAGTATVAGTLYAKSGAALTLTVVTSSDTVCVDVTGALTGHQTSPTGKSSWSFGLAAPAGADVAQTGTAVASPNVNQNNRQCTRQSQLPKSARFTLDNTAPAVTGALSPTPNAAGWNNSNASITWSATDAGSGVGSGPTPATDSQTATTTGVTKTSTATDRVGNLGSGSVTVKLDKNAPTINGSRSPGANANGWNNTNVVVSFSCSDSPAGIKACSGPTTLSTSAASQSVTGTAVDNADNNAGATVSGINIDKVAPTLSGAPTTSPNVAGWYKNNVAIAWTCNDVLSGIDGAGPANSTISSEGTGQNASTSVSDKAGHNTNATSSPAVKIDKTPPTTGISGVSNNWVNANVPVTLSPSDGLSGVASTTYTVDGGTPTTGVGFTLNAEGDHTVTYFSTDAAGNSESVQTAHIKIDKTAPTIGHASLPAGFADGAWTNVPKVTVTFTCGDTLSGVASCTAPVDVTTEGGHSVAGAATDSAGNSASDTATVNIDRSPPTISASPDRAANGNGWYNDDVTVTFSCADQVTLSGLADCPVARSLGEGQHQSTSGTAHDNAGNSATVTLSGIDIDKTKPTITGTASPAANGAGWNNGAVTVTWVCSDALSGLASTACPAPTVVGGEGGELSASASVTDRAGNTATGTVSPIKIDQTPPVTTAELSESLPNGWYADAVHITLSRLDSLSGVAATHYSVDNDTAQDYDGPFDFDTPGTHTITFWSDDAAGNTESSAPADHTVTVKIDGIPPQISGSASPGPNGFGWNNSNVDVSFVCTDAESGIASCLGDTTLTGEGAGQSVDGTATDNGGNTSPATVSGISIDKTAPSLSGAPTTAA